MKDIKKQLSILGTKFSQNLLADERSWHLELGLEDQNVLPNFLVEAARKAADEKGITNPIITLSRSIITPFLKFSPNRKLRKQLNKHGYLGGCKKTKLIIDQLRVKYWPCADRWLFCLVIGILLNLS